jgi:hypothetical protein
MVYENYPGRESVMLNEKKLPESDRLPFSNQFDQSDDAVFLGWQKVPSGDFVALYNITVAGHPSNGSTVCDHTLRELNLRVPEFPQVDRQERRAQASRISVSRDNRSIPSA